MEAAGALRRGSLSTYLEAVGGAVRARSRTFWIVAGLTVLAAALRFATLGIQSYHHDEIVTASRILRGSFWHAMDAVGFSESAPPLYYALAWLWTQVTGTAEYGLRSLSALAGVATVPVVFLLGAELRGRRTGIVAAALVAANPMLIWYSQEARAYALLVLLTTLSLLYFVRALQRDRSRDLTIWGVVSGLALATHYFAIFPIAAEALWLLWRRGRGAARGLAVLAVFAVALAPLAVHQASYGHAEWIAGHSLGHRLWEMWVTFGVGEIGDVIARPERPLLGLVPGLAMIGALLLLAWRGERSERHAARPVLVVAAATVGIPLVLALLDSGKDYVLARNLLPALVPLLVAIAVGLTLRRARRAGTLLAVLLVAYSFAFSVWVSLSPALQRPDWSSVASAVGEPAEPRAMVAWTIGLASLRYYLSTGSFQAKPAEGFDWWVGEVDFISDGPAPPPPARLLGPGFRQVAYEQVGRIYIRRYTRLTPGLAPLRLRTIRDAQLNFRTNGVLLDGIGPR
ncbi:MAG TPA: glycosyltransferase family 39 protein [Solirubrobacterales bacterium]|nr:glycosyltransferase family 39 protein [Solirubrobacterales bacterium]